MLRNVSAPRGHVTRGAEAEHLLGPYFFIVFEVSRQTSRFTLLQHGFRQRSKFSRALRAQFKHESD